MEWLFMLPTEQVHSILVQLPPTPAMKDSTWDRVLLGHVMVLDQPVSGMEKNQNASVPHACRFWLWSACIGTITLIIDSLFTATVCTSLLAPRNGLISYNPDVTYPYGYQTIATYNCSAGFGLVGGDRIRLCVNSSSGDGQWVGIAPSCEGESWLL